jgi:hypothetical protein
VAAQTQERARRELEDAERDYEQRLGKARRKEKMAKAKVTKKAVGERVVSPLERSKLVVETGENY